MEKFIEKIIDWEKFDASTQLSKRINGVTKEAVEFEVQIWEQIIKNLPPMEYKKITEEINEWEIGIPRPLTYENIAMAYSRLVSYKLRISKLLAEAKTWTNITEDAIKHISELSKGIFSGTAPEKSASAAYVVQPFVHLKTQVSRLENYLDKVHTSVVFCAAQLDCLLKERQSQAKLNFRLGNDGDNLANNQEPDSETPDGDEEFSPIQKKPRRVSKY